MSPTVRSDQPNHRATRQAAVAPPERRVAPAVARRLPVGAGPRARLAAERLTWVHPARSELSFENHFQLLVAVILSAQSTDRMANRLASTLLERYPGPAALAAADPAEVERILRPIGFFRAKAHALIAAGRLLELRHGGQVPGSMDELLTLPGVGRKTANAILGVGFGAPAVITDRHLIRVARRLRLVSSAAPPVVEAQVHRLLPPEDWTHFSLRMTLHGRYVCLARRPLCDRCVLNDFCPSSSTASWPMEERRRIALTFSPYLI